MTVESSPLPEPGIFAVSNHKAWIGRKEANLRRRLLDCGCPTTGEVFFHLWCDRLACRDHADAAHDCGEFKGKSGIEKEAVPVEAVVASPLSPLMAAAVAAQPRCQTCGRFGVQREPCDHGGRHGPYTLADMEAASAAVQARRRILEVSNPGHPLDAIVRHAERPFFTTALDSEAEPFTEHVSAALDELVEPSPHHVDTATARFHLIGAGESMREVPCDCPKPMPWWRRMLGGTR